MMNPENELSIVALPSHVNLMNENVPPKKAPLVPPPIKLIPLTLNGVKKFYRTENIS